MSYRSCLNHRRLLFSFGSRSDLRAPVYGPAPVWLINSFNNRREESGDRGVEGDGRAFEERQRDEPEQSQGFDASERSETAAQKSSSCVLPHPEWPPRAPSLHGGLSSCQSPASLERYYREMGFHSSLYFLSGFLPNRHSGSCSYVVVVNRCDGAIDCA